MTTSNTSTLSHAASALASALIQSSPYNEQQQCVRVAAMRPGETQVEASRRAVEHHDKAIQKSLADNLTTAWPEWVQVDRLTTLGKIESVSAAMDLYYKPERLSWAEGMRENLIRSRQDGIAAQGWTILASHHDAVNGRGLYIRKEAGALVVYASQL